MTNFIDFHVEQLDFVEVDNVKSGTIKFSYWTWNVVKDVDPYRSTAFGRDIHIIAFSRNEKTRDGVTTQISNFSVWSVCSI